MTKLINKVLAALIVSYTCIWSMSIGYTQSATQLPPATPTFFDNNGKPLASGTITFNAPSTTTPKTVWQDSGKVVPWSNPIVLNAAGRPPGDKGIFGDGTYQQIVKDRNGNTIWNQPTSSVGGGGGGSSSTVGDGDIVGVIKAWAGYVVPSQYLFAAGQAIVRTTYTEAFAAITFNTPATCTIGSPTIVGVSSTEQLPIGAPIESVCFNTGSTVTAKPTPTSLTISSNAIITATTTARIFPWGNGDGNTTFNLPDLRGRTIAGRNNMNNITASNLTTAFFGTPTPNSVGGYGGAESRTLTAAQSALPSHSHGVFLNDPGHQHSYSRGDNAGGTAGGGGLSPFYQYSTQSTFGNNVTGMAIGPSAGVGGNVTAAATQANATAAVSIVQPTATSNYIIKVTPDTNSNSFFGVASIGGMQGILLCGTGVTCAGNTISSASGALPPPTPTVLGGVFSKAAVAGTVLTGVDLTGAFTTAVIAGTGTVTNVGATANGGLVTSLGTGIDITTVGTLGLANIASSTVLGNSSLSPAVPVGLNVPACNGASNALNWTVGGATPGFGCATIAGTGGGGVDASTIQNYKSGLTLSTTSTPSLGTNVFGISTGSATDNSNTVFMLLPTAYTKTTAPWTLGSAGGSLDTGSILANQWYNVFLMNRPDTSVTGICISLNLASCVTGGANPIPAAFTQFRRIGSMFTNGLSNWTPFTQTGAEFIWTTPIQDFNGTGVGTTRTLITLTVPNQLNVKAKFYAGINDNTIGTSLSFVAVSQADIAIVNGGPTVNLVNLNNAHNDTSYFEIITDTSRRIAVRASAAVSSTQINTFGWTDNFNGAPTMGGGATAPSAGVLQGYINGLTLSTTGSNTYTVSAGSATDNNNAAFIVLVTALNKTTGAWVLGSGNGALDAGTIAINTWYHAFIIQRPDTGVVASCITLNISGCATGGFIPAAYTQQRRVGSMKTDGSFLWTKFIQDGSDFTWDTSVVETPTVNQGTAAVTRTLAGTPAGIRVKANLWVNYSAASGVTDNPGAILVSDLTNANVAPAAGVAGTFQTLSTIANASTQGGAQASVYTNISAQVRTRLAVSTAGTTLNITTIGWTDNRAGPSTTGVNYIGGSTSIAVSTTPITGGLVNGVLTNLTGGVVGNTAAGQNGQVFLGSTSAQPTWGTVSGDATINNTGVVTLNTVALSKGGTGASITANNGGIFYSTATVGALLNGTATANLPLVSGISSAPSWASITYPTSATSGGIPFFSSPNAMGSSSLLVANALMVGGGSGVAPSTITTGTGVNAVLGVNMSASGSIATLIGNGSSALGTGAIASAACATAVTSVASGVLTTDVVTASFNGDPTGVTGYVPITTGMLTIVVYPTVGNVNFRVCNNTATSITPGAITLNWRVIR